MDGVVKDAEQIIEHHVSGMKELDRIASQYPYYKYNGIWSREVQTAVRSVRPKFHVCHTYGRIVLGGVVLGVAKW